MFEILVDVKPDIIALGYDQEHAEEWIRNELDARNLSHIDVKRVEGLEGDLDGTRKIVRIIDLWNVVKKMSNMFSGIVADLESLNILKIRINLGI